ncbi:MAG: hypothetical protein M1826_002531 [Phylliscum demangeonii]|nr:MAG: hypothetical protein M1826_002531 [Phylliscum demangeonii]
MTTTTTTTAALTAATTAAAASAASAASTPTITTQSESDPTGATEASESGSTLLPYWLVNVPRAQWPPTCPDFLATANAKDREILSTPDARYHRQSWEEVKELVRSNRLEVFQRMPSDLRRYMAYTWRLQQEYGSVMNFVLRERLRWPELAPRNPEPFRDPADWKILWNDWPYGIDPKIVHLVVWTRFELADDPATDDLTPGARRQIGDWSKKVIWFKNWRALKSVHAVEHFHVMLYDPDPAFLRDITHGDRPLSEKLAQADEEEEEEPSEEVPAAGEGRKRGSREGLVEE